MSGSYGGSNHIWTIVLSIILGGLYVLCSAATITFNKYLMRADRFPFPLCLSIFHMLYSSIASLSLFVVKPSIFPALATPAQRASLLGHSESRRLLLHKVLPIGAFFSLQLVLSNSAYLDLSVAFMQMMKMSNVVIVYALSLCVALERFSYDRVAVLVALLLATAMTVEGEAHFSIQGFLSQGISQVFGCLVLIQQGLLLSGSNRKLDALSYTLLVSPVCLCFLLTACLPGFVLQGSFFQLPKFSDIIGWGPLLVLNGSMAFALNLSMAIFVHHTSPMALTLAGLVKDAAVVVSGAVLLHEVVGRSQKLGFFLQLCLIFQWSRLKQPATTSEEACDKPAEDILQKNTDVEAKLSYGTYQQRP